MTDPLKQLSETEGLPLAEALRAIVNTNPFVRVHLGAKDGSGFIDIAPAVEMANPKYLERLSDKKYARSVGIVNAYRKNLCSVVDNPPSITSRLANTRYDKWYEEIKTKTESLSKSTSNLLAFVPLSERKVVSAYPRALRDGIVLIVSGTELGPYWTAVEKNNKKKTKSDTSS